MLQTPPFNSAQFQVMLSHFFQKLAATSTNSPLRHSEILDETDKKLIPFDTRSHIVKSAILANMLTADVNDSSLIHFSSCSLLLAWMAVRRDSDIVEAYQDARTALTASSRRVKQ